MPGYNNVQRAALVKCNIIDEAYHNIFGYTRIQVQETHFISVNLILEGISTLGQLTTLVGRQAPDLNLCICQEASCVQLHVMLGSWFLLYCSF